jgi:integrase/recombinase XerD
MTDLVPLETASAVTVYLKNGVPFTLHLPEIAAPDGPLLALWLHGKSAKTVEAYSRDLARYYQVIGKPLAQMTLADLQAFATSLTRAGLQPSSCARTLFAVKSVLTFGVKVNMLPTNVGAVFQPAKAEDKLAERIMSEQSADDMLRLETNPRNHAMLALLYYGGLRVAEVCNLRWRHLHDRDLAGQVTVFGKGSETRHILLDTETWSEVWALRGSAGLDDYVFQSRQSTERIDEITGQVVRDRRLDESRVHQIVRAAADRAGVAVGKVSPHWLRHAHATHALENGAPITLVQKTLGHKRLETTAKYTHVRPGASSSTYVRRRKSGAPPA